MALGCGLYGKDGRSTGGGCNLGWSRKLRLEGRPRRRVPSEIEQLEREDTEKVTSPGGRIRGKESVRESHCVEGKTIGGGALQ